MSWAEVIVLGCGGTIGFASWLSKELGVPVIDPTVITFKIAEAILSLKLKGTSINYQRGL